MIYPLKTAPVFKQYLWGGNNLETKLSKQIPDSFAAESWEISCHDDGLCTISNGEYKGMTLKNIIFENPKAMIGKENFDIFPLLVKFIDANDKLSVQVHPDNDFAAKFENGQLGKSEMWYVLDAQPDAKLIYGLKQGVSAQTMQKAIENGTLEEILNYVPVKKGDFFYIPAGTIHAICEGLLIAEIQQSSNLTYRVYDYNRCDKNGNKRELHTEKAIKATNYNAGGYKENNPVIEQYEGYSITSLVDCEYFTVKKYCIEKTVNLTKSSEKFEMIICVDGKGKLTHNNISYEINKGDSFFIPAAITEYLIEGQCEVLRSYE